MACKEGKTVLSGEIFKRRKRENFHDRVTYYAGDVHIASMAIELRRMEKVPEIADSLSEIPEERATAGYGFEMGFEAGDFKE